MNNYEGTFETVRAVAPSGGVTSGTPVVIGKLFGVPVSDAAEGDYVSLVIAGKFLLPKATPLAIALGDVVYWDAVAGEVTKTNTDLPIGFCATAAGSAATTVQCTVTPGGQNDAEITSNLAAITDHIADTADAHDASAISVLDANAKLTATEVEAALEELYDKTQDHEDDSEAAHAASAISIADAGGLITATEVEAALQEVFTGAAGIVAKLEGAYQITFAGNNGAGYIDVSSAAKTTGVTPAADDLIIFCLSADTAAGTANAMPTLGGTDFAANLVDNAGTISVQQINVGDLSGETYQALLLPMS